MIELTSQWELAVPLVLAAFLGGIMGLERSVAGKQAGMRTYALVALGSCLFTLAGVVGSYSLAMFAGINPLHIAGSVAIGIGFIGAGLAAMRSEEGHVELTTAAGIWVAASAGVACGLGLYGAAIAATVISVVVFSVFLRLEDRIRNRFNGKY